jgi:hypothetical protein
MSEEYTELFKVEYNGKVSDLHSLISSITGVEKCMISEKSYEIVHDDVIDCEIRYNSHVTDRTKIANKLEENEDVSTVLFG